ASSDPRVYYQATGSWEGTLGADRVRGIIAPDGSYHLAVVDVNGDFIEGAGEYVGSVTIVDKENNIGRMTVTFLRPPDSAEILPTISLKLTGTSLFSLDAPYNLNRTNDADGPGAQADVAGRWSLSVNEPEPDITNLIVDTDGNLSGNDGDACQYSGTLKLIDPAWNIFELNLKFSDYLLRDCKDDTLLTYEGLAMALPVENNRKHLWLASTVWTASGTRTGTYIKNLAATINVAPVAKMTANAIELPESVVQPIKVKKLSGMVKLDARGSSDGNKDPLTYQWSVTDPDGTDLANIAATPEGVATLTPTKEGVFTLRLTANDGILDSIEITREILVKWVADRFVDCYNGTVLDTTTNLFWLKDAGCSDLHGVASDLWWVNLATAKANVSGFSSPAPNCGLNDGSLATNWRLPLLAEFETIIEKDNNYTSPPDLVNGIGNAQWSPGNVFVNVGDSPFWIYWTAEPTFVTNMVTYGYIVDFAGAQNPDTDPWSDYYPVVNKNAVWTVRDEISAVPGDEVNACLQAAAQP
ncbi:MAG: hypothetical protein IBX46_05495, partial [Desulfuromonadales bacterium]|nr:hypothetical protein [Desulfuromonadales bacterium]